MAFKTVFDPDFKYRSADATDIRLTFDRIRRELQKAEKERALERTPANVLPIGPLPNAAQNFNDRTPH